MREPVVQVLGGLAHQQCFGVDDLLGEEAGVRVHALTHGVPAHVLDTGGQCHVVGTHADAGRDSRGGGQRPGAHPVDGEAGHRLRQAGQHRGTAPQREALVADLGGRGHGHLVDALRRQVRVAPQEFAHHSHDQIVGPGLGIHALRTRLAERGARPVDHDNVATCLRHADLQGIGTTSVLPMLLTSSKRPAGGPGVSAGPWWATWETREAQPLAGSTAVSGKHSR